MARNKKKQEAYSRGLDAAFQLGPSNPERAQGICNKYFGGCKTVMDLDKAFKKVSVIYHPDKQLGDADATEIFQYIVNRKEELENNIKLCLHLAEIEVAGKAKCQRFFVKRELRQRRDAIKAPTGVYMIGYSVDEAECIIKWQRQRSLVVNKLSSPWNTSMKELRERCCEVVVVTSTTTSN